ncbi:MAG: hypothetical protein WDA06_04630 [Phenylobacterium sp.]
MQFTIVADGFRKALSPVYDVATKCSIKDWISENRIAFNTHNKKTIFRAYNGRIAIQTTLSELDDQGTQYRYGQDGDVVVNAKDLINILKSFPSNAVIICEKKGKELCIKMRDDTDQFQTMPCYDDDLTFPAKPSTFKKTIDINRLLFLAGLSKIFFAIGYEAEREKYLYWVLRFNKDFVRFAAGTGAIFAVADFEGKDIITSVPNKDYILLNKEHTIVLQKVLESTISEAMKIQESNDSAKDSFQILITLGNIEMQLIGMNPDIDWIDENTFLNLDYSHKIITKTTDWEYAGRGVVATFNDEMKRERRNSKTTVELSQDKATLFVQSSDLMKAKRKVEVIDYSNVNNEDTFAFSCSSVYIPFLARLSEEDGLIQIEKFSENDKKPIIVRYYADNTAKDRKDVKKVNSVTGYIEKLCIFFAQMS